MWPLFAYFITLIMIGNPAAISAAESDSYSAIFSAPDDSAFVQAVNTYFGEKLNHTSYDKTPVLTPTTTGPTEALGNSFYVENSYTTTESISAIEFMINLGSATASTFTVQVIQNGNIWQSNSETVSNSQTWQTMNLTNPISGTFNVKIIGSNTHSGDSITEYGDYNYISTSTSMFSTYYHDVITYVNTPIYKWVCVYKTGTTCDIWDWELVGYENVPVDNWYTDTINYIPAIKLDVPHDSQWFYQISPQINGYHEIDRITLLNGIVQYNQTEGFVEYPSLIAYSPDTSGTGPNLATGVPFDQQIMTFVNTEEQHILSFDINTYFSNLYSLLATEETASPSLWDTVISESDTLFSYISGGTPTTSWLYYVKQQSSPIGLDLYKNDTYQGLYCVFPAGNPPDSQHCDDIETINVTTPTLLGELSLASSIGLPFNPDTILLLKTSAMSNYPTTSYFFNWIWEEEEGIYGLTYNQTLTDQVHATETYSPATTTVATLENPDEAFVNITDGFGNPTQGSLPVQVKDTNGNLIGQGTVVGGSGYVSVLPGESYGPNDVVYMTGTGFYKPSQATGTLTQLPATANVSLVLNSTVPAGTSPYEAEITVTDSNGNVAMGNLDATLRDGNSGNVIKTITIVNGSAYVSLPTYYDEVSVSILNTAFYDFSSHVFLGYPQYNLSTMLQTLGPDGSNATENAKVSIIRQYIENPTGAFTYNATSQQYTMTSDLSYTTTDDNGTTIGYELQIGPTFTKQEVDSGQFDSQQIAVIRYYDIAGGALGVHTYSLSKMDFFNLWLGQKLQPLSKNNNPGIPSTYTQLDSVASDYSTLLHENESFFGTTDSATKTTNQNFVAQVQSELVQMVNTGFPPVSTNSLWQAFVNFVNGLIQGLISAIQSLWNDLVQAFNSIVSYMVSLWNTFIAPAMGPVIEAVKSIVTMVLQQIVNTVVQPILNGQTTSLSDIFGGVSPDTIASYGPSAFSNIETTINSQSSQLSSVGSTIQSMMSSLSVFSGAGTILGPLISMAGPGIMVTVLSMIASVVMNSVLTPLFSQLDSTTLQNDLDTLMAPLGGTQNGSLGLLNNIAALTSVTNQPGVVSQDSGSGYVTQSTGSSAGTSGIEYSGPIQTTSSSSSTCDITAIGTCLAGEFNAELLLSQTLLDNSNGAFNIFNTVTGVLINAMEALTGSSTTSSAVTPSTSTFAMVLGGFSVGNDLIGYIKTGEGDKVETFGLQFVRFTIAAAQFLASIYYNHEYPSSASSNLWFVKSSVSLGTNIISLLNDFNNVAPQSFLTSIGQSMGYNSFNVASQELKSIAQFTGIAIYVMYYQEHASSLSALAQVFMFIYVAQKIAKIVLFFAKATGNQDNPEIILDEQRLYEFSGIINAFQMGLSLMGIG